MSSKFAQFLVIAAGHKLHLEKEAHKPCLNYSDCTKSDCEECRRETKNKIAARGKK
jgi:hypothetical protein